MGTWSGRLTQRFLSPELSLQTKRKISIDLLPYFQLSKGFLKCVEQCAIEARNKKMAEGFKIDPTNTLFTSGLYTDFVKDEARKNWQFASKITQKLNDLVELAKTVRSSRFYSTGNFPEKTVVCLWG